jgi:hypothetical protein
VVFSVRRWGGERNETLRARVVAALLELPPKEAFEDHDMQSFYGTGRCAGL